MISAVEARKITNDVNNENINKQIKTIEDQIKYHSELGEYDAEFNFKPNSNLEQYIIRLGYKITHIVINNCPGIRISWN